MRGVGCMIRGLRRGLEREVNKTFHFYYFNTASSKYCFAGTLSLGLAGSGTNKFSALTLENLKYRPLDDALLKQ